MAEGALAIMESLRAGRIQPDHAVVLLMYEARWPVEAAERGVYGPRDMQAMQPMAQPRPCGCDDDIEPGGQGPMGEEGTVEDLILALQQQVEGVAATAEELKEGRPVDDGPELVSWGPHYRKEEAQTDG